MDYDDFPDLVDGATPITTGTPVDEAFWDDVQAALLGELRGVSDPTRTPAQTTDEVLAARGVFASLLARLTDWEARQYVTPSQIRNGFALGNLLANDTFAMWSRGDAAAPDYWTLSGTGATIARCGVGQADTQVLDGQDHFSAKLTYGSAAAVLKQKAVVSAAQLKPFMRDRYIPVDAAGARISGYDSYDENLYAYLITHAFSNGTSRARAGLSFGTSTEYSPYHPGNSAWATLVAGPAMFTSNHELAAELRCEASGSAYFQCVSLLLSPLPLQPMYVPARVRYKTLTYYTNNPATGVLTYFTFARPAFILGAQMQCLTAGTGTAATCDLLTPISGTYQSLFATLPTVAINQLVGAAQACDPAAANYRRRTIRPALSASATQVDNTSLRLDYVDDGGGALRDLMVTIHYFEYDRPFDQFRTVSDLGE